MFLRPHTRASAEHGFTLIELLVVVLIIGALAAIALPVFVGQQRKGQDADAKSGTRSLLTLVEACNTDRHDLRLCDSATELEERGLQLGTSPGQFEVRDATQDTTQIVALSRSGNEFIIDRDADGDARRSCTTEGRGSCPDGGKW